jgi:hypothetical protein
MNARQEAGMSMEDQVVKTIILSCCAAAALLSTGIADAQNRGGGGGGGMSRGGGMGMSGGGGMSRGGGMAGGSGYRGGYGGGNGYRGGYHGGGSYRGGYAGGYRGGSWHGNDRHWGHRGGSGWRGWGPRVGVGFYFGAPLFWDYGFAYPYPGYVVPTYADASFYSTPLIIENETDVYVQPPANAPAPAANYWYYCTDPAGYYPYVQTCNKAWVPVSPQSVMPSN